MLTLFTKIYCKHGGIMARYTSISRGKTKRAHQSSTYVHISAWDLYLDLGASWLSQHRSTTAPKEKRIKWPAGPRRPTALRRSTLGATTRSERVSCVYERRLQAPNSVKAVERFIRLFLPCARGRRRDARTGSSICVSPRERALRWSLPSSSGAASLRAPCRASSPPCVDPTIW